MSELCSVASTYRYDMHTLWREACSGQKEAFNAIASLHNVVDAASAEELCGVMQSLLQHLGDQRFSELAQALACSLSQAVSQSLLWDMYGEEDTLAENVLAFGKVYPLTSRVLFPPSSPEPTRDRR